MDVYPARVSHEKGVRGFFSLNYIIISDVPRFVKGLYGIFSAYGGADGGLEKIPGS